MRPIFRQGLTLALLALAPAIAVALFHPKRPSWKSDEVPLSLARHWKETVLWIDARPRSDFEKTHVPGAMLLNEDEWNELLPAVLDAWHPDDHIIVYCRTLSCQTSHDVAKRLRTDVGLPEVYVLQGGWESWLDSRKK